MNICIIYQKKNLPLVQKGFETIIKSKKYSTSFIEYNESNKMKSMNKNTLYYYDISGLKKSEIEKHIKKFNKEGIYYGIIDLKNTIKDIAWFFHNNACDYCNKEVLQRPIPQTRLQYIIKFKNITLSSTVQNKYIIAPNSWDSIAPGNEYTFCFLFIEILDIHELKKHIGSEHLNSKIHSFRRYCEELLYQADGRCWMWMDSTGLFLFPFNGDSIPAIYYAIRLMLNRSIISLEHTTFNQVIQYRIAMHIGNTVYQPRGKTGTIISDCINSLFHLGQKYTTDPGLFITQDVYQCINEKTQKLFMKAKPFEGRQIYTFKYK
ncbi:MAG: hypothetical protein N3F66_12020 [Spirochaetes bacterium]|nr:hypothetical protein [Spirochaetota bacterium]